MELVNQTGVPAELVMSDHGTTGDGAARKVGLIVAKVTYEVHSNGAIELVTEDPHPILMSEEPTALGILPRDVVPPGTKTFDVMALAAAYAPGVAPVAERTVTMWVGDMRDDLCVTGDREWHPIEDDLVMTPPAPFTRMPLTWERAFGGSAQVWMDEHTPIPIAHHYNALGRGFDPRPMADGLAEMLRAPESFPRIDYHRMLPNVESVSQRVTSSEDDATPCCWAPMPAELGLRAKPTVDSGEDSARASTQPSGLSFAAPHWRLSDPPNALASVGLTGCRPLDGVFAFRWPALKVCGDYVLGDRTGVRELIPRVLVLLPEEDRFTVTYRAWFSFVVSEDGVERSVRLRLEE